MYVFEDIWIVLTAHLYLAQYLKIKRQLFARGVFNCHNEVLRLSLSASPRRTRICEELTEKFDRLP